MVFSSSVSSSPFFSLCGFHEREARRKPFKASPSHRSMSISLPVSSYSKFYKIENPRTFPNIFSSTSYFCLLDYRFSLTRFQFLLPLQAIKTDVKTEEKPRGFRWVEIRHGVTETQKLAISKLPYKMTKRCTSFMKQIICYSPEKGSLVDLLGAWVRIMKPCRADWLSVLKELKLMDHPLYIEVAKLALLEESFEVNNRDYTKIIHFYGKQNRVQDAENTLSSMKRKGFICDQVTLTAMVDMHSKAGHHEQAEEYFEEIKLLGQPVDKRSYGAMIMAYIRAGMLERGENLLREMDALEIYAGSEVYKALLRAYSMVGNTEGAKRVFDAVQLGGISPDDKLCALLINAYAVAGRSEKALIAFENMRKAGIEPTDKCIALVLAAYEKDSKLNKALEFLMNLERDGIIIGKEASEMLARWFKRLGVIEEVELVLREYIATETKTKLSSC